MAILTHRYNPYRSLQQLVDVGGFDQIVVELSGVADPNQVKGNFEVR